MPRFIRICAVLIMTCLAFTAAQALDLEVVKRAAETGDAKAQYDLGVMYYEGKVVAYDSKEAEKWFLKSAKQGYVDAQYQLGAMYVWGRGVTRNKWKAERWFRKAAEQGHTQAQHSLELIAPKTSNTSAFAFGVLFFAFVFMAIMWRTFWSRMVGAEKQTTDAKFSQGQMHAEGLGVPQDYTKALKLFLKAAEDGHAEAQYNLGLMYAEGRGIEQNYTEAAKWFRLAAIQENEDAKAMLEAKPPPITPQ